MRLESTPPLNKQPSGTSLSKRQATRGDTIEQRLLAQMIARQQQPPPGLVPQRKREHAAKLRRQLQSPAFISVHQGLRVAATAELMSQTHQLRAQIVEVVNL